MPEGKTFYRMLKHQKINTLLLLRYLRCSASAEEEKMVRDWLADDPDGSHARKYRDAHYIFEGMSVHGRSSRAEAQTGRAAADRSLVRIFSGCAAAVAAVALMMAATVKYVKNSTLDMVAEKMERVFVPSGRTMELTLEDGTRMWLNSGTEVEYPAVFGRKSRNVKLLKGEALFDVARDEDKPFTVTTFASDIKVLGTKFDVMADEDASLFRTSLLRGSVSVSSRLGNQDIVLKPEQTADMRNGHLVVSEMSDPVSAICWKDGLVNLTDVPFDQLMKRFENVYDINIVIDRKELPSIRYSRGKVRVSDGIDHAMEMLSKASDFKWTHDRNTNTITVF